MVDFRVSGTASLDPDRIIESVDSIIEKLDKMKEKIDDLDLAIDRLSGKNIDLGVNIDGEEKLTFLRELLDDLDSKIYIVSIDVDVNHEDKIEELKLKLDEMDAKRHTVGVDIDLQGATRATSELVALDEELNHKQDDFDKAKKSSEGFQFSLMSLLPLFTAIIPVAAAAGGGIVALAGAFAAMVPGIAGVFLAAKPAMTAIQNLTKSLDQNTKNAVANANGYEQIYKALEKNSQQFQKMSPELQDLTVKWFDLQNAYTKFQKAVDPAVFTTLGSGMSLLKTILSGLPAVTIPAAAALQHLLEDFQNRLHDPVFQSFFKDMKTNMYELVHDWGTGVLNIIEGLTAIFHAFMPLSMTVSGGFLRMTESFNRWAQSLSGSKGFQQFVDYVKKEGPVVLNVLGQLVLLIGHIGASLSGMGGGALGVIDHLLQGLNNLAKTNPGLFQLIINVGIIGIAIAKLLPVLGPLLAFLATPGGAIVGVLVAVGAGFVYAYTHSKAFHDWVVANLMPMWNDIVHTAQGFVQWAKGLWPDLVQIWDKYGKTFEAIVKAIWDFVGNIFQAAVRIIEGIVDVFVGLLTGNWQRLWDGIKKIVSGLWQTVESLFRDGVKLVGDIFAGLGEILYNIGKTIITGLWNGMKDIWHAMTGWLSGFGGNILQQIGNLSQILYDIGKSILSGLWDGMKSIWNNDIEPWLSSIGNWIGDLKGPIEKDRVLLTPHGKAIMGGLMDGMQSQMPAMESQLKGFAKTIENTFGDSYTTDISAKVKAAVGDANYNMSNYQQGGRLPAANSTQMHFAAGAFVIQGTQAEKPSDTITRVLQGAAKFGTIQAPVGYTTGG